MFPTTDWGLFESVRGADSPTRMFALETPASRYWRPVFLFIRQHGSETTDAEDLTQEFIATWLAKDTFAKADSGRGRFQSLLQSSLKRFLSNAARANRGEASDAVAGLRLDSGTSRSPGTSRRTVPRRPDLF